MHAATLIGAALCLLASSGNGAAQFSPSETRMLQIAALKEFRATSDTTRITCIGIFAATLAGPQREPTSDPDSAFLADIGSAQRVRPISACEISQADPESTALTRRDRLPARVVRLWAPEPAAGNEVRIWISGRGGFWRCTIVKNAAAWGRPDCQMIFQT